MQDDQHQIVDFPIRGDKVLVYVSHSSLIDKCKPLPSLGKSDHVMVDTLIYPTLAKPSQRRILPRKRADTGAIREGIQNMHLEDMENIDVNQAWTWFKNGTTNLLQKHVPTKLNRSHPIHGSTLP
jgi:hypothetical protein